MGGLFIVFQTRGDTTFGVTITTNPDLSRGLVGHWTFDGGTIVGATTTDVSGNGNDGTIFTEGLSSTTYSVAGADTYTVPQGVTEITVKAWGAGGGGGGGETDGTTGEEYGGDGGGGGFIVGTIPVTPGETLSVVVGGGGAAGAGHAEGGEGGGGGGHSEVNRSGALLLAAAGGGGGGGSSHDQHDVGGDGGEGGGTTGGNGTVGGSNTGKTVGGGDFGEGGTQTSGGAGGSGAHADGSDGTNGSAEQGGAGGAVSAGCNSGTGGATNGGSNGGGAGGDSESPTNCGGGGGGGGGYYGGGGGEAAVDEGGGGGGGGSSYATSTASATSTTAGSGTSAGNNGDSDYAGNAGQGGAGGDEGDGVAGNAGRVVISATTSEIALVPGTLGQALEFDGTDDLVTAGDDTSTRLNRDFTLAAWVYFKDVSNYRAILSHDDGEWYFLKNNTSNKLALAETFVSVDVEANTSLVANTWYHAVVTVGPGTPATVTFYLNGVNDGSGETSSTYDDNATSKPVVIGSASEGGADNMEGIIDDVRIYDRALSAEEVKRMFDLGNTTRIGKTITTNPNLNDGLAGHWSFDGKDMDISAWTAEVRDSSGNGNHGDWINHATTTTIGKLGQALEFDGSNDYVDVGDIDFTGEITLSSWINTRSQPQYLDIITKTGGGTPADYYLLTGYDEVQFGFYAGGYIFHTTSVDLDINTWYHVVATFDDSANNVKIYINGVEELDESETNSPTASNDTTKIGGGWTNEVWDGFLDDVRIYDRVLSAAEVKRLYELGQ